jgi:nigerose phosphorylase
VSELQFVDGWVIRETEYLPEQETSRATVFALANGYMGLRGAPEELPASLPGAKGCYVNGIYDTPRGKLTEREILNIPDWTALTLRVNGESFFLHVSEHRRDLDMRRGVMRRHLRAEVGDVQVTLEAQRFLSMAKIHLGVIRWRLTMDREAEVEISTGIDADVNNRWAQHFKDCSFHAHDDAVYAEVDTFDPGYRIRVAARTRIDGVEVGSWQHAFGSSSVHSVYGCAATPQQPVTITKWAAVRDSRFSEGPLRALCHQDLANAEEAGYDALLDQHCQRWAELWDACEVTVEGDQEAQMGIRFAQFHLLAPAPYHSDRVSIPARGLQGQDYYGSVFWDCDMFVLPMFAHTLPDIAKNILRYRYHTLDGARRKAAGLGYGGAYYAWQSQETGDEQCDLYVFTHPATGEPIRSYFADEQIHISADIVYAAWQYYQATGNSAFWADGGAEIAVETARFYVSRADYDKQADRYYLLSVLGPDEYHERVDNNAYTNYMARESVRIALDVLSLLQDRHLVSESELAEWRAFLDKLHLPAPDPATGLIQQFDGYFELKEEPVPQTRKRLSHPGLHYGGHLGPFQETQNIKQADVVMLLYVLRDRFDAETKRRNWQYYEPRTAHDSSLSPMAYSLVAADIGMMEWAHKYFLHTSHIDLRSYGPHWNLGIHAASLGGAWLAIAHGFCRVRLGLDGLHLSDWPQLPKQWQRVVMKLTWHGRRLVLETDGRSVGFHSLSPDPIPVRLPGEDVELRPGASLRREYHREAG